MQNLKYDLMVSEVPEWLRMPNVVSGYRLGGNYKQCFKSLFEPHHNEFMNAWTMITSNIMSFVALIFVIHSSSSTFDQHPSFLIPFIAWYLTSALHMPFSVGYHLFCPMSKENFYKWRRLDVSFIFIASICLTVGLSFFVFPVWGTVVLTIVALMITIIAIRNQDHLIVNLDMKFQAKYIASIVCVYITPMIFQAGSDLLEYKGQLTVPVISTIVVIESLFFGSIMYATGFPESRYPKRFDEIGSSHQIMHTCILIAHLAEFAFIYHMLVRYIE